MEEGGKADWQMHCQQTGAASKYCSVVLAETVEDKNLKNCWQERR
jgi:hypothetical protein